jgi:antitoxin component YwqK of YwqJK toxin-antitoxin module
MKKLLFFAGLLIMILAACSSEKMNFNKLQDRNGLFYVVNQDKPFSGEVVSYIGGRLEFEGTIDKGLRTGLWTYYYPNGQKKMEGMYNEGLKDGTWTYWKENGTQDVVEVYKYGKLLTNEGTPSTDTEKKDSVKVVVVEKEKPEPEKKVSTKPQPVVWERLKGGPVKYLDGVPYSGPVVKYYKEGGKELEGWFTRGHRSGKWIYYDRLGNVKDVRYY